MEFIARVHLGMTSDQFYTCTWYDWGFEIARINELARRRREDNEVIMEMFRTGLCYYYNWNSKQKLTPQDFWKLSYDERPKPEDKPLVDDTINRLERIAKKRKRG